MEYRDRTQDSVMTESYMVMKGCSFEGTRVAEVLRKNLALGDPISI